MSSSDLILTNGRIITPLRIEEASIVIKDSKIGMIIPKGEPLPENIRVIDIKGSYVCPGFVDIHVHGGGGSDVMDCETNGILKIAESHAKGGTTSIIPTTTCGSTEDILSVLDCVHRAKKSPLKGAKILGVHLEGPYVSPAEKGALDSRYIRLPKEEEYLRILDFSQDILIMTVAPELDGALDLAKELRRRNIVPAIGHTDATFDQVVTGVEAGFRHITHLYSSMPGVRRINLVRVAGVVEAGYLLPELTVELIADGKHLPPALLKLAYQIKGPDKIALITDAMRAAGLPEGKSILGGIKNGIPVIVEDGVAKLPDKTAFAGSVALTSRLVKNMVELAEVPIREAVQMATLTPARIVGLDNQLGMIAVGREADLVVLSHDLQVQLTVVSGVAVYQNGLKVN